MENEKQQIEDCWENHRGLNPDDYPDIFINRKQYPLDVVTYEVAKTDKALDFMPAFLNSHIGEFLETSASSVDFCEGVLMDIDYDLDKRIPISGKNRERFLNDSRACLVSFRGGLITGSMYYGGWNSAFTEDYHYIFSDYIPFFRYDYNPFGKGFKENLLHSWCMDFRGCTIRSKENKVWPFPFTEKYPNGNNRTLLGFKDEFAIERRFSESGELVCSKEVDLAKYFLPVE